LLLFGVGGFHGLVGVLSLDKSVILVRNWGQKIRGERRRRERASVIQYLRGFRVDGGVRGLERGGGGTCEGEEARA